MCMTQNKFVDYNSLASINELDGLFKECFSNIQYIRTDPLYAELWQRLGDFHEVSGLVRLRVDV